MAGRWCLVGSGRKSSCPGSNASVVVYGRDDEEESIVDAVGVGL